MFSCLVTSKVPTLKEIQFERKREALQSCFPFHTFISIYHSDSHQESLAPDLWSTIIHAGLPWWLSSKNPPANAGDLGSIPGSGRSPKEGNGNTLPYACLGNPMDRGTYHSGGHKRVGHDLVTRQQKQKLLVTVVLVSAA